MLLLLALPTNRLPLVSKVKARGPFNPDAKLETLLRSDVNRIQVTPTVTDALRMQLGITVRQAAGGATQRAAAAHTDVPGVVLETIPVQVIIH